MEAIIFDLNGVLILDRPGYVCSELELRVFKRMGMSLNDAKEKEEIKKELGWTEKEFWSFVDQSWQGAMPNMELVKLILKLKKAGYKTAILSNTSGLVMRPTIKSYFGRDINDLFDEVVISSEVGLLKPDPAIYKLVMKKLGTTPPESVFIDDAEEYLLPARNLGMTAILFRSNQMLRKALRKVGIQF